MKKIISLAFVFAFLLIFISCQNVPVTPKATKSGKLCYSSSTYHPSIETETRILLANGGKLFYYSKVDGESYVFCFNPLCQHTSKENCLATKFLRVNAMTNTIAYNDENSRFYALRGQKIYSFSFDASDVKLEYSLGSDGEMSSSFYDPSLVRNIRCAGDYVFFMYKNDYSGHEQIYRLDTKSGKLAAMTSGEDEWVLGYEVADGYIYYKTFDSKIIRYFTADFDFENKKEVTDPIYPTSPGVSMGVYDGKLFYERAPEGVFSIDLLTSEKKLISSDEKVKQAQIMSVTYDGIYFITPENTVIGKKTDDFVDKETQATSLYNRVYKLGFDGNISVVFDMPKSDIQNLNVFEDCAIVSFGNIYYEDENGHIEAKSLVFVLFEISEDGLFVNPKLIGNYADDAELIECLKGL